jgi:CHAT domain-containing protein
LANAGAHVRANLAGAVGARRLAFAAGLRWHLDSWVNASVLWPADSYDPVLAFKGLVARTTAAERRLGREASPEVRARLRELRTLARRLASLSNDVPFDREARARWQVRYAALAAEREQLELEFARDFTPLREAQERLDLSVEDVQGQLGSGEVLVDVLRAEERYVAWVLGSTGPAERVDLGPAAAIEEAAATWVAGIADEEGTTRGAAVPDDGAAPPTAWVEAGRRLAALVLDSLRPYVPDGAQRLYLCPDAALAAVPFAALGFEDRLLGDRIETVHLAFATDLVPREARGENGAGALALGRVDYADVPATTAPGSPSVPAAPRRTGRGGRMFLPLPGTGAEVAMLEARLGEGLVTHTGSAATEAALRRSVPGRRLVHLATHGFVRTDLRSALRRRPGDDLLGAAAERQLSGWDPMLLAGLALAGANERSGGGEDDGIFSALEASYLDLDACDLVVLSACDTARGKAESGEGVLGLVRGFQMAGAKQVIASLWPVDDEATRLLMERFYALYLDDESPRPAATALREASLWLRDQARGANGRRFDHPRHWAAFVVYGR